MDIFESHLSEESVRSIVTACPSTRYLVGSLIAKGPVENHLNPFPGLATGLPDKRPV